MKKIICVFLLIAAIGVFAYSGWQLYGIYNGYSIAEKEYESLEDNYVNKKDDKYENDGISEDIEDNLIEVDFDSLEKINDDIIGWIDFPACSISYPVLQTENNDYYLTHTFENKENHSGAVFLDYENAPDMSDNTSLIYGHNMKNGSMFGRLKKLYQETNLRSANPYFYFYLKDNTVLKYEIFSYYVGDDSSKSYNIVKNEENMKDYINYCLSRSIEKTGINVDREDKIMTLATCYGSAGTDKRFFVHGKLLKKLIVS